MDNLKDDSSDSDEDYEERAERELASQAGSALEETRALHEFTSSLAMSARDNVAIDPDEQSRSAAARCWASQEERGRQDQLQPRAGECVHSFLI